MLTYPNLSKNNKKHLKNVGPIHYCEPPLHCQSPGVASRTPAIAIAQAACDVHDNNNNNNNYNAWQRGPLWLHGMGPVTDVVFLSHSRDGPVAIQAGVTTADGNRACIKQVNAWKNHNRSSRLLSVIRRITAKQLGQNLWSLQATDAFFCKILWE